MIGLAFDDLTKTLLFLERALSADNKENVFLLVSLRRNASELIELMRLSTIFKDLVISVCDSRVLLTDNGNTSLYLFNVSANNSLFVREMCLWRQITGPRALTVTAAHLLH